ncbi:alanyl-tRNA synthetase family protein [Lachnospiraceae bacterium KM106-2]|nr:alanyl-tRNA synthetase family protein [Lachnospiraceae bacterium KM106-2]
MTKKLYYENAYEKECRATVVGCEKKESGYEIILDQTIFYPEGGGQPSDIGTLKLENGEVLQVSYVFEKGEDVCHVTDGFVSAGSQVTCLIDWKRRYHNMQQHSGEHILSGLIHERFGYDNVGFHMGTDMVTVDFNGVIPEKDLKELEARANEIIYENSLTKVTYPSKEELDSLEYRSKKELTGQVRIVGFDHADICACCGTHVKRTGEIGVIKVLSSMNYKGGTRFFMLSGEEAYQDYVNKNESLLTLSRKLSAKPELVVEAVDKLQQELKEKKEQMNTLYQQLFTSKAAAITDKKVILFEEGLNMKQIRDFVNLLMEKCEFAMVVSETAKDTYQFTAAANELDMKVISKQLNEVFSGKGGGNNKMIQGTLYGEMSAIKEKVEELI